MIDAGTAFPWTDVLAQDLRAYAQTPFLIEQNALWITSSFSLRYVADKEEYPHDFVTTFAPYPVPAGVANPVEPRRHQQLDPDEGRHREPGRRLVADPVLAEGGRRLHAAGWQDSRRSPVPTRTTVVEGILGPDRDELYDVEAYRTRCSAQITGS